MKILITGYAGESIPPPYGGIPKKCLLYVKEWVKNGVEVTMHFYRHHNNEDDFGANANYIFEFSKKPNFFKKADFIIRHFLKSPVLFLFLLKKYKNFYNFFSKNAFYAPAIGVWLNENVKKLAPDVIIAEVGMFKSLMALEIAKKHGIPFILETYAEIQYQSDENGRNVADDSAPFWKYLCSAADLIVACSEYCAIGPLKYADREKVAVIYPGIDFDIFSNAFNVGKKDARAKFNLPQDKFIIIAVGSASCRKGHDQLLKAASYLTDKISELFMVIVSANEQYLIEEAKRLKLPKDFLITFSALSEEELSYLYRASDVFCFPSVSERECFGMPLKEAAACSLPIAAYDTGGVSEGVGPENGILVPSGDVKALSSALRKIIDLPDEGRKRLGKNGKMLVQKKFDIKTTSSLFLKKIENLRMK